MSTPTVKTPKRCAEVGLRRTRIKKAPQTTSPAPRKPELPGPLPTFIRELRDAVRNGTKTMTRRVIRPQPARFDTEPPLPGMEPRPWPPQTAKHAPGFSYGKLGSVRYLREPLVRMVELRGKKRIQIAAYQDSLYKNERGEDTYHVVVVNGEPLKWRWKNKVLPSVFMPREAARFFVVLTERRAEWLHDISESDARAEGPPGIGTWIRSISDEQAGIERAPGQLAFKELWNSINAKRGHRWETNPLCWVAGWEPVKSPDFIGSGGGKNT